MSPIQIVLLESRTVHICSIRTQYKILGYIINPQLLVTSVSIQLRLNPSITADTHNKLVLHDIII